MKDTQMNPKTHALCVQCGHDIDVNWHFCPQCGKPVQPQTPMEEWKDASRKLLHYQAEANFALLELLNDVVNRLGDAITHTGTAEIQTCDLVEELKTREGVETHVIGPTDSITVHADGPAIIMSVID